MTGTTLRAAPPMALALAAWLFALASPAHARGPRYAGPHPVASSVASEPTWCHLGVPHVHSYAPERGALYAQTPEGLLFTADPTPFGYRGPTHVYVGHHPVPGARGAVCYLDGPHRHAFAPEGDGYEVVGGAAFFVGEMGPDYPRERAVRARAYQLAYQPFAAQRPVVTVEPPAAWKSRPWGAPSIEPPAPSAPADPSVRGTGGAVGSPDAGSPGGGGR